MKTILVDVGEKKILVKMFKTSFHSVQKALNGERDTLLAYKIRKAALERGGMEVEPVKHRK